VTDLADECMCVWSVATGILYVSIVMFPVYQKVSAVMPQVVLFPAVKCCGPNCAAAILH